MLIITITNKGKNIVGVPLEFDIGLIIYNIPINFFNKFNLFNFTNQKTKKIKSEPKNNHWLVL